jgi:hypothetical protein
LVAAGVRVEILEAVAVLVAYWLALVLLFCVVVYMPSLLVMAVLVASMNQAAIAAVLHSLEVLLL